MNKWMCVVGLVMVWLLAAPGCGTSRPQATGYLLPIGGALEDTNTLVYDLFVTRASEAARGQRVVLVVATAATADEAAAGEGRRAVLHRYAPESEVRVISRGTGLDETLAALAGAHGVFFTGGDQKRVADRYRPDGKDTPELDALREVLRRGGVIAGTSAGDAMMSDPMFLTGRSAEALGVRPTKRGGEDDDAVLGPRIGTGLGLFPWGILDSHFFERDRFGRLVAALEASGMRLGIGVSENAAVEVDLSRGSVEGVSDASSLLVDVGGLTREGLSRRGVRARLIQRGDVLVLTALQGARPRSVTPPPGATEEVVPDRKGDGGASGEFFRRSRDRAGCIQMLALDGYRQRGWPAGDHWIGVDIEVVGILGSGAGVR